jgi:hypothetical protein
MAQVVNNPTGFGAGLGRGLSAGLTQLAEQKFAELERRSKHSEKANRLKALGLSHEESDYLAGLEDKFNYLGASNYFGNKNQQQPQGQQEQPQQVQQQGTLEQLTNATPSIPGTAKSPEQLMLESLASGQPLSPIQALMKSLEMRGGNQQQIGQTQSTQPNNVAMGNVMAPQGQNDMSQQVQQQPQPQVAKNIPQQQPPQQRAPSIFGNAQASSSTPSVKPQQQASIDRANAPFVKDLDKRANAAKELIEIADRMESLVSSGKVSKGPWGAIQQRLGKIIPQSPETEQFDSDASAAAILKASLIPGTVTNERLKASERTKPSINQTPESQLARIRVMRNEALGVIAEDEVRSQIIEENGGNQPPNMRQLVEKRAKEIKKEFRQAEKAADLSVGSVVDSTKSSYVPEGTTGTDEKGNPVLFKKGKWVRA